MRRHAGGHGLGRPDPGNAEHPGPQALEVGAALVADRDGGGRPGQLAKLPAHEGLHFRQVEIAGRHKHHQVGPVAPPVEIQKLFPPQRAQRLVGADGGVGCKVQAAEHYREGRLHLPVGQAVAAALFRKDHAPLAVDVTRGKGDAVADTAKPAHAVGQQRRFVFAEIKAVGREVKRGDSVHVAAVFQARPAEE